MTGRNAPGDPGTGNLNGRVDRDLGDEKLLQTVCCCSVVRCVQQIITKRSAALMRPAIMRCADAVATPPRINAHVISSISCALAGRHVTHNNPARNAAETESGGDARGATDSPLQITNIRSTSQDCSEKRTTSTGIRNRILSPYRLPAPRRNPAAIPHPATESGDGIHALPL